jgi:hypothetical protein
VDESRAHLSPLRPVLSSLSLFSICSKELLGASQGMQVIPLVTLRTPTSADPDDGLIREVLG